MKKGQKELTAASVIIGVLLAVIFGAANAYLGLRAGMTISASIPAAVVSMGIMRFLLQRKSSLETNIVQTIGSAGETQPAQYLPFRHYIYGQKSGMRLHRLLLKLQ